MALGEVLTDPADITDANNPHWVDGSSGAQPEERVEVRYHLPEGLPLWWDQSSSDLLGSLSVSRAMGGTVFNVAADPWEAVLEAVSGWPEGPPEIADAREVISELAGRSAIGQGFRVDSRHRRAIENYAMRRACEHYRAEGWSVEDVSARRS